MLRMVDVDRYEGFNFATDTNCVLTVVVTIFSQQVTITITVLLQFVVW